MLIAARKLLADTTRAFSLKPLQARRDAILPAPQGVHRVVNFREIFITRVRSEPSILDGRERSRFIATQRGRESLPLARSTPMGGSSGKRLRPLRAFAYWGTARRGFREGANFFGRELREPLLLFHHPVHRFSNHEQYEGDDDEVESAVGQRP